jgi:hypothetical protein
MCRSAALVSPRKTGKKTTAQKIGPRSGAVCGAARDTSEAVAEATIKHAIREHGIEPHRQSRLAAYLVLTVN